MNKILMFLVLSLFLVSNVWSATGWVKGKPAASDNPGTISTTIGENNSALDLMLSNFANCKISYTSATTISVSAGGVMVSNAAGTVRLMLANSAATSVTFTDIDTGAEAASTTYYVYAIGSATTDTVFTIKVSLSATAPDGVTYYKRLGSFYNDASSNIATATITNDNDTSIISSYDSGWFAVSGSSSYTKTHSLGTTKLIILLYFSASSDGSSPMLLRQWDAESGYTYGCLVNSITTTQMTITTAASVALSALPNTGAASGYYRVIALALK